MRQARKHVENGHKIVVDIDIQNFFDKINQDKLMSKIARQVTDKRVLRLIRKYLQAGVMINGVCVVEETGSPQGSPLSPLLANIYLDELDKDRTYAF